MALVGTGLGTSAPADGAAGSGSSDVSGLIARVAAIEAIDTLAQAAIDAATDVETALTIATDAKNQAETACSNALASGAQDSELQAAAQAALGLGPEIRHFLEIST